MNHPIDRRRFIITSGCALCAAMAGCAGVAPPGDAGPATVDVGPVQQFSPGVDSRWAKSQGFFIVREGERIFAVSSICTHRRCPVQAARRELVCECHGSRFTIRGVVLSSPATKSLPHLAVRIENGHLIVERTRQFDEAQWNDPAAYVVVNNPDEPRA